MNLLLLSFLFLSGTVYSQSNIQKKNSFSNITVKVIDQQGNALSDVLVTVNASEIDTKTDVEGALTFKVHKNDIISFSKNGFEKNEVFIEDSLNNITISLNKTKIYGTIADEMAVPFGAIKKRNATGNYYKVDGYELQKYPSNDIRNAFVGLAPGVEVMEKNGSLGLSAEERLGNYGITEKVGITARGNRMKYIIDDIAVDITELPLDPEEIESVTFIKDIVGKAKFGPDAANGVIYIKTKRGRAKGKVFGINYEQGISSIDRFPQWVSGADYAKLNNNARTNSGLAPLYSEDDIAAYAQNNPYDMVHPSINFRDMVLKNTKNYRRTGLSSSGGSENLKYSAYLGYNEEGDIYKIGAESNYNRIVARSNLDFNVNELIKISISLYGGLSNRKSPNYGYATKETEAETDLDEFNSLIYDITLTPAIAFPVYANNSENLSTPWYGVGSVHKVNPIANMTRNGYYTETGRSGASNLTMEYDMKNILSGLKSTTFFGINVLNLTRIGKAQRAPLYVVAPTGATDGTPEYNLSLYQDGIDESAFLNLHDFYTQRYAFYQSLDYEKTFGKHDLESSLTYYLSKAVINGTKNPDRLQNAIFNASYTYNDKYILEGVLNYSGSGSFAKNNRYAMFPSVGLGWIISEENFMSGLKIIDFLKVRSEYGILGYDDLSSTFNYQDRWNRATLTGFGPHSLNRWFGNTTSSFYTTSAGRTGNPDLTWEKRKEFSVGLDALLFNQRIALEVTYYNNLRDGQLTQIQNRLPNIAGVSDALPYFNFNQSRYYGLETGLAYTNIIGKLKYTIRGNATIQNSKRIKYDEPNYRFDYQNVLVKQPMLSLDKSMKEYSRVMQKPIASHRFLMSNFTRAT